MDLLKGILVVGLITIMILGVSGCMNKKKHTPETIKEEMLTYLENKYGEEFVPVSLALKNWAYSHDSLRVYPKKGTREDYFYVQGVRMDDGTYSMRDGYFGYIIKDEYEAVMKEIVGEFYEEFKLYTSFGKDSVFPDRLNKGTKLSEIYDKNELFSSDTTLFVKEDSAEGTEITDILEKIAEKMIEKKLVGSVTIHIINNTKFEEVDLSIFKLHHSKSDEYFVGESERVVVNRELVMFKEIQYDEAE